MLIICFPFLTQAFPQRTKVISEILSSTKVTEIFTDTLRKKLNLTFPIRRVYKISDKSGQYYCVLTESIDSISTLPTLDKDTLHFKIKAANFRIDKDNLTKVWELNDKIESSSNEENSIWFWTKYIDFKDYDNDGLVDPIVIYGTSGLNDLDDGRIKLIIFFKGHKIAIRHQNGVLDQYRGTQVDKAFYSLPQTLQSDIKQKMEMMTEDGNAIFPRGWQTAMKNQKTVFNERQ